MNNGTGYGNYGASRISRAMRSWHVGGGSAKEDIEDNLDILRKRSRDAYMGIPLATGAIKTLRTNVVGSGLVPTPQVDADYLHLNEEQADRLQAQISREFELGRTAPFAMLLAWITSGGCRRWRHQFPDERRCVCGGAVRRTSALAVCSAAAPDRADLICSPDRTDIMAPCTIDKHDVFQIVQGVETNRDARWWRTG
jgi:hypothetical protein